MLHRELADLACAIEPALNIARPPAGKIAHRQREKLPAEKIENSGIEPHRGKGEQIFLCDRRQLHKNNRRQGHHRKIAKRNLQRSRCQTELDRRATKRFQTRAISSGVTELSDAREADLAPEMTANHA